MMLGLKLKNIASNSRPLQAVFFNKMSTNTLSIDELKKKSTHADNLIEKLKKQIQEIKMSTTPEYVAEKN